jgi:adenylate cyclase
MPKKFDYTTKARAYALRFPRLNYIGIQITFWIYAFLLLSVIIHFTSLSIVSSHAIPVKIFFTPSLILAIINGILYGTILGFVDIYIEKRFSQNWPMGRIIVFKAFLYLLILIGAMFFLKNVFWEYIIIPYFYEGPLPLSNTLMWHYYFKLLLIYTFVMSIAISFINLMNKKFGPGILIPMLLGRYRNPREEERIFMFMDLKSSTTHAEQLGHIKYSALIRDAFFDINQVLARHNAEIYQYVGDEIVVSWPMTSDISGLSCVEFFFATQHQFNQRRDYYIESYGFVPQFKAGLHLGVVTAVEVGEIKRDIAYHGDTLNTAARIQSVCNQYDKILLVSADIKEFADIESSYSVQSLGELNLKGKGIPIAVYSVEDKNA